MQKTEQALKLCMVQLDNQVSELKERVQAQSSEIDDLKKQLPEIITDSFKAATQSNNDIHEVASGSDSDHHVGKNSMRHLKERIIAVEDKLAEALGGLRNQHQEPPKSEPMKVSAENVSPIVIKTMKPTMLDVERLKVQLDKLQKEMEKLPYLYPREIVVEETTRKVIAGNQVITADAIIAPVAGQKPPDNQSREKRDGRPCGIPGIGVLCGDSRNSDTEIQLQNREKAVDKSEAWNEHDGTKVHEVASRSNRAWRLRDSARDTKGSEPGTGRRV